MAASQRPGALPALDGAHVFVGQDGILRPIGNRPINNSEFINGPITNRPQVNNLSHTKLLTEICVVERRRQLLLDAIHGFLGQLRLDLLFDFRPRFLEALGVVLFDLDNVIAER